MIEAIVIKKRDTSAFFKLKDSSLIGCLHITDSDPLKFNKLKVGDT